MRLLLLLLLESGPQVQAGGLTQLC